MTEPPRADVRSDNTRAEGRGIGAPREDTTLVDRENDEAAIDTTLGAYARGYTALSARAVKRVWPTVDEDALRNAFGQLDSQQVAFAACGVDVQGRHASAICRGTARYVPKVGSGDPVTMTRVWHFALRKVVNVWVIDSVR